MPARAFTAQAHTPSAAFRVTRLGWRAASLPGTLLGGWLLSAWLLSAWLLSACTLVAIDDLPPPRDAPAVQFQQPTNNASYTEGEEVVITLLAQDGGTGVATGAGVARVDLFIDDLPHQSSTPQVSAAVPVFTVEMNWQAAGIGLHALSAVAYREDGTPGDRATISISVVPGGTARVQPPHRQTRKMR